MKHEVKCPFCGQVNHFADSMSGREEAPEDGDASVCANCRKVGVFMKSAPGGIRKPTLEEIVQLSADPRLFQATRILQQLEDQKK